MGRVIQRAFLKPSLTGKVGAKLSIMTAYLICVKDSKPPKAYSEQPHVYWVEDAVLQDTELALLLRKALLRRTFCQFQYRI